MTPRIIDIVQELLDLWSDGAKRLGTGPSNDIAIDALDDIRLATLDMIASITFGASLNGVKASLNYLEAKPSGAPSSRPDIPQIAADLEVLLDTIADGVLFPAPRLLPWLTRNFNRKWRKSINRIHDNLRKRLYAARAEYALDGTNLEIPAAHKADNVLNMIMEREKEDQSKGAVSLTEAEIIDELTALALGGIGTVKILCKHPDVQRKLRSELFNNLPVITTRPPTCAEISEEVNLPYLSAVVYEILRYSKTASAVARDATCDTVLLGYPIPKGTQVLMLIGMIQQIDERSGRWSSSDVHSFNPERWLRQDGSFNAKAGPWLPFSQGFRGCFGQKLAVRPW
ncbi:cytochrome P450 [Mycena vulgaris]|nr:cytochrome P450 [Mycena vulgaris]